MYTFYFVNPKSHSNKKYERRHPNISSLYTKDSPCNNGALFISLLLFEKLICKCTALNCTVSLTQGQCILVSGGKYRLHSFPRQPTLQALPVCYYTRGTTSTTQWRGIKVQGRLKKRQTEVLIPAAYASGLPLLVILSNA